MANPAFELGTIQNSARVDERMRHDIDFKVFVNDCIGRYKQCDWGGTPEEDRKENNYAVFHGEEIIAFYDFARDNTRIMITTAWDRSSTTILFPDEY